MIGLGIVAVGCWVILLGWLALGPQVLRACDRRRLRREPTELVDWEARERELGTRR